jgi:hypothetical protein
MPEPIRTGGGNLEVVQEIDELGAIGSRRAGSEGERRAARHLQTRLQELGREVVVEPSRVRPAFGLAHLANAVAGIVGSVLSVYVPLAGLALVVLAAVSAFGDLTGTFHLTRLLTGARASQNVVSDEDAGKPGLLVLAAHYDAPRSGMLLEPRLRLWPVVFFWSLAVIAACALLRVFGFDATWLTIIQFIPTVFLIAACPLFLGVELSHPSEGVNDNASGVATVLRLAERYGGRLEHFDLMVVFTGASAHSALGMRNWLKRHRADLEPEATAVIAVDAVGAGTPHYATKEGPVVASRLHPTLVQLCADDEAGAPFASRELSDAYAARAAGLPAIRISSRGDKGAAVPDEIDAAALAQSYEYLSGLVERIDTEIGPRLG